MKKILLSLVTIGLVSIAGFAVTQAFFSDTEESKDNTITAGTIDIELGETETIPVSIDDMKPSYVRWSKHVVRNVGNNPVKLWKHITNIVTDNNDWTEPECTDQGGTWTGTDCNPVGQDLNNIDEYIVYDMYTGGDVVGDGNPTPGPDNDWFGGHPDGNGQMIISEADGITLHDIESVFVYLGELAPANDGNDDEIVVWQSYHMKDETENWAQSDQLTFDIEFYAEQVNGTGPIAGGTGPQTLLLENKDTSWNPIIGDGKWGVLKWAGDGNTFDFSSTLKAHGLLPSTNYSLIYYPEPQTTWPWPVTVIASGDTNSEGDLEIANSVNLNMDLENAKIWLAVSSDIVSGSFTTWPPTETILFEYNLINYDDTDAL